MSGAKKLDSTFEDPLNAKIQRKFDSVFADKSTNSNATEKKGSSLDLFDGEISFNTGTQNEIVMEKKDQAPPKIDLDFSMGEDTSPGFSNKNSNDGLEFNINLDQSSGGMRLEAVADATTVTSTNEVESGGFTLSDEDIGEVDFDEATQKTVRVTKESMTKSNVEEFSLKKMSEEALGESVSSADMMSTEEARTNIETTIKDILRPKLDKTSDIDLSTLKKTQGPLDGIEDSELVFSQTPSKGFTLADIPNVDFNSESSLDSEPSSEKNLREETNTKFAAMTNDSTGDFKLSDLQSLNDDENEEFSLDDDKTVLNIEREILTRVASIPVPIQEVTKAPVKSSAMPTAQASSHNPAAASGPSMNTEDSMRFQATIRSLREEREEMLATIKTLKGDFKELEQDNLTLKASLDEAKIEISILRKRHMVELEDMKYRLALSEEKKAMSVELARQADLRREKLEQKVRIDFNQVKQREKELESKLELLSMDVDSQVQSRDHKILELRRKIDALEFNMENASIKEQKSLDDKRKLEDRLNKIMKTLRHSIKNLEDDIDHMEDDGDHQKDKI